MTWAGWGSIFEMLSAKLNLELEQLTLIVQQDLVRLKELLRSIDMEPIEAEKIITQQEGPLMDMS